jgi:hypothetical protein
MTKDFVKEVALFMLMLLAWWVVGSHSHPPKSKAQKEALAYVSGLGW